MQYGTAFKTFSPAIWNTLVKLAFVTNGSIFVNQPAFALPLSIFVLSLVYQFWIECVYSLSMLFTIRKLSFILAIWFDKETFVKQKYYHSQWISNSSRNFLNKDTDMCRQTMKVYHFFAFLC